jgi:hypothetical protein
MLLVVALAGVAATPAIARAQTQDPAPLLLVLDKDAIDYGPAQHLLPGGAVDPDLAGIGVREELPYFQSHVNSQVVLTGGNQGNDGWFAVRSAPAGWSSAEGVGDGLENFALAGPGLGSPNDDGDREALLETVPNIVPIRADGLNLLVGRMVCAVVYADDVIVTPGTPSSASLKGATLGRIAFSVVSVLPTDDSAHPNVQVQIAEGHEVCASELTPFVNAPDVQ